jgi:hypothetical protein
MEASNQRKDSSRKPQIFLRGNDQEWKQFLASLRLPAEYIPVTQAK